MEACRGKNLLRKLPKLSALGEARCVIGSACCAEDERQRQLSSAPGDGTISHMSEHEPLSIQQLQQLHQDVAELADRTQEIATLLQAAHGPEDPTAVRAQEARNAIQRLQWAMERQSKNAGA
jgi:hypothetical protein